MTLAMAMAAAMATSGGGLAQAQDNAACASAMVGTWLATIDSSAGQFASRALVTIHADGTLAITDSAQHQGVQGSSFSQQQGSWRCTAATNAQATTLNFGYPPQPSIARSDWTLTGDGKTLSGGVALHVFSGVRNVDPFRAGSKPVGAYRFTAQRVAAGR